VKADSRKDVAAIVEGNNAKALFERNGNTGFSVDDHQLIAAARHVDLGTVWSALTGATDIDITLWPRAVQREAAQRIAATGKERLTQGDAAVGKRLGESDADAVGPHDVMKLLSVQSCLGGEFREIDTGAELAGVDIDFKRSQHALVFVENIVARIAGEICAETRETNVLVSAGNEFGNFDTGKIGFAETVFDEEEVLPGAVDEALDLISADLRCDEKIGFSSLRSAENETVDFQDDQRKLGSM